MLTYASPYSYVLFILHWQVASLWNSTLIHGIFGNLSHNNRPSFFYIYKEWEKRRKSPQNWLVDPDQPIRNHVTNRRDETRKRKRRELTRYSRRKKKLDKRLKGKREGYLLPFSFLLPGADQSDGPEKKKKKEKEKLK